MKIRALGTAVFAFLVAGAIPVADAQGQARSPQSTQTNQSGSNEVSGITIPDSKLARDATKAIHDAEGDLLFQHSVRVYYWAALAGKRKGLSFDPDLLYVAAMFHDFGLTAAYGQSHLRYEVDGANAARDFLQKHGASD